jgi:flagellar basal body-associated protein FliL
MADKKDDKELTTKDQPSTDVVDGAEAAAPKKPSGLFTLLKALGIVAAIVLVEVVAASMFIPSAQYTEKLAKQLIAASTGEAVAAAEHDADNHGPTTTHSENLEEVELGRFNVTRFNPATNSTLSIDFELFGAVLAKNKGEFTELLEKNKIRVREQIILTMHGAEAKDLSDAGLGLLKRQILEKTNRALSQPLLKEVLFGKFNFIER